MSLLSLIGVSSAYAAETAAAPQLHGFTISSLLFPLLIVVVFYFLLIRPQTRRAKEQKNLLTKIAVGDEVMTAGGIVGTVTKLRDNFIVLMVAKDVQITLQKSSIASVLPKGTIDAV